MDSEQPESAQILAPPPVLYLGALAIGFLMHAVSPQPIFPSGVVGMVIGACLLAISAGLARWSFVTMRRFGTSASPREPSMGLVTHGPFRLSRNPIYLAMTGLYLAIALLANSWCPLWLLPPLLLVMHWGVILREERYLERRFGETYRTYKLATRRWL